MYNGLAADNVLKNGMNSPKEELMNSHHLKI
jgi:hypothetical protein